MQDDTLERWKTRLGKAAQLLSARLDDPPPLEELAAAAAISPFHFHRIWRALTGETVSQSVLRLRIEASQQMLAAGGSNVTEVAMAAGFGTPQSFARAFRRQTGVTPTAYRQQTAGTVTPLCPPQVEIEQRDETLVVALRHTGDCRVLNRVFATVWGWATEAGLIGGLRGIYGIPYDDPESVATPELRYDACLALGEASPPAPFKLISLPGGPAARLRHYGPYEGLEATVDRLIGDWLLTSDFEPADHPMFNHYLNDPDTTPEPDLITDVYLPLKA